MRKGMAIIVLLAIFAFVFAYAQEEKKVKAKVEHHAEMKKAIERGKALFADPALGTTGQSCNSCHEEFGMKAVVMGEMKIKPFHAVAKSYPKYLGMAKKVMTLDQVINLCITAPMKGEALPWDDQRLADLAVFVASVKAEKHEKTEKLKKPEKPKEEEKPKEP